MTAFRSVPSRRLNARTRSSSLLGARAFPRECRFLRTSHPALAASLRIRRVLCFWSSRSLERAPEGCRDTSNRLLPPNLVLLSTSLHPCSRRSKLGCRLAPIRFERPAGSRRASLLGRDRSITGKVFACRCRDDLRRLTSPSAIRLRTLRPLSRTRAGSNHFGHFYERAVTLTLASLTERRLPLESTRAPASFWEGAAASLARR